MMAAEAADDVLHEDAGVTSVPAFLEQIAALQGFRQIVVGRGHQAVTDAMKALALEEVVAAGAADLPPLRREIVDAAIAEVRFDGAVQSADVTLERRGA